MEPGNIFHPNRRVDWPSTPTPPHCFEPQCERNRDVSWETVISICLWSLHSTSSLSEGVEEEGVSLLPGLNPSLFFSHHHPLSNLLFFFMSLCLRRCRSPGAGIPRHARLGIPTDSTAGEEQLDTWCWTPSLYMHHKSSSITENRVYLSSSVAVNNNEECLN